MFNTQVLVDNEWLPWMHERASSPNDRAWCAHIYEERNPRRAAKSCTSSLERVWLSHPAPMYVVIYEEWAAPTLAGEWAHISDVPLGILSEEYTEDSIAAFVLALAIELQRKFDARTLTHETAQSIVAKLRVEYLEPIRMLFAANE